MVLSKPQSPTLLCQQKKWGFDTLSDVCVFFSFGIKFSFLKIPKVVEGEEFDEMRLNKLGDRRGSYGRPRVKAR